MRGAPRTALALVAVAAFGSGCRRQDAPATPGRLNLLIVLVDTLRADHLGFHGYERATSPNLDRLARESVQFERAFSHSPWTMPSVASFFTSLEPKDHGIADWKQPLDLKLLTLAEHLKANGYRTEGYVSHGVLAPVYQFDQGFDVYDASVVQGRMPREISTAREITDKAVAALARLGPAPWLMWVHYFDPHDAYLAHQGFDYGPRPMDRYDSEIAYTDQQIGRLLDDVRRRGLLDRTVVVFLADHGEGFGEHGSLYHSTTLYDELLHVPLLLRIPGVAPSRVASTVAVMDVAPTVVSLLGLPIPETFRGQPLRLAGGRFAPEQDHVVVAETYRDVDLRAIRSGPWKLIMDRASGGRKLFDMASDPGERRNLRKQHPELVERLSTRLEAHYAEGSASASRREIPAELQERLRSLGYVE